MTSIMDQMRSTFRTEAQDLLIELDTSLLALEMEPGDAALVHRVFRAVHTIKGSGGTAGFAHLARFVHKMEEAFDLARDGRLAVTPSLIDCGLKACDVIRLIIEMQTEDKGEGTTVRDEAAVSAAFERLLPGSHPKCDAEAKPALEAPPPRPAIRAAFEIVFRPKREMFYSGADPVTLLDELRELGQAHVTAHADQVPQFLAFEAEHCYLWWEILLVTEIDAAAIKDVFVFVADDCEFGIRLLEDQAAAVALFGSVPAESLELFVVEAEDHLESIERDALLLEKDPASRQCLDSLFRSVHSIKGNAGLLLGQVKGGILTDSHPLQLLLRVAHGLESLLDRFRGQAAGPVTDQTVQIALETCDAIHGLLANLMHKGAGSSVSAKLLERLGVTSATAPAGQNAGVHGADDRNAAFLSATSQSVEMIAGSQRRLESGEATKPVLQTWLRGLKTLSAAAQYRKCPELDESLALQLLILDTAIRTGTGLESGKRSALAGAFASTRLILDRMTATTGEADPVSEREPAGLGPSEPVKVAGARSDAIAPPATIRIDQNKLDRLMRVVGELLVARGAFPLLIQKINQGTDSAILAKDLKEAGSNISRIADELQTSVMSIRMLPIKTIFQKFPRLVRDLAHSLGKEVKFVIEGEGIELDKTILEQIGDPLVHVIRNALDHGLEPPAERVANGKPAAGQLILRATYEAADVVIEITEDGRGLNAAALRRKAVEKGLLAPDAAAAMSEEAAFQLVFLPGLSTAAKVTDVSGRGVGMDVVRSNVRNLQGSIEIRSQAGQGTTFRIKLPASLMISKGILLKAGGQEYILPLSSVRDMVKLPVEAAHHYRGVTLAQIRGNVYPIFNLSDKLGLVAANVPELSIAIVEAGAARYGLVVDQFLTEVEVLIKPLVGGLEHCKEFQGAAIMGDGRVVLVLNALECHNLAGASCN